jgi:SAM-dependent methyltransferase
MFVREEEMDYEYIDPPLPSVSRFLKLYRKFRGNSPIRVLEYERLEELSIQGDILDVGGGKNARYRDLLPKNARVQSINIDPEIAPTFLIDPDGNFPINKNVFDAAVCFNTLEHIYDARHTVSETHRVLKPGATLHITVPFIFRIHGHPDDYFRATPSWWRKTLEDIGFTSASLTPLVWGRNVSAGDILGYKGLLPKQFNFNICHLKDVLYAAMMFRGKSTYSGKRGERICAVSLGWFISATK